MQKTAQTLPRPVLCQANAYGDPGAIRAPDLLLDLFSDLFREGVSGVERLSGNQEEKLFPSKPDKRIQFSDGSVYGGGDLNKNLVTRLMSILIIDGFEVVDVHENNEHRHLRVSIVLGHQGG